MRFPSRSANLIVHGFALAHAALAALILNQGYDPGIYLTILTIAMIVILARMNEYPLDVTAALTLVCILGGFFMGTKGAEWFTDYLGTTETRAQIYTTALVTEILGWITYFIVSGRDVLTGKTVLLDKTLTLGSRETLLLEL